MDLFRDIAKGRFGKSKKLKKEAKHELSEFGGKARAEAIQKKIKCGECGMKECKCD